ncbi:hypothetical protein IQ249_11915 [Lusitaniella coriacea LEGE 07157]|uniref:Uncharacterized protein n=1 Tax=Lusitaniella coriacea LEGE 07157 TaxID=945747 RepID=A0A8J7DZL5_9CYAN|nr:hypothetical protein [Lusitaniella coriacea]MBE9116606.1 hypothetical protein [Lusitaniella coriacea LEGE 07157]
MFYVTRQELKQKGASRYLARQITQKLPVVGKKGNSYLYKSSDIIDSAENKIEQKRTHQKTKKILKKLISWLREAQLKNQEEDKIINFGSYLAKKQSEEDGDFLKTIESNIKKMKEIRNEFRAIVDRAKERDPNAFTTTQKEI